MIDNSARVRGLYFGGLAFIVFFAVLSVSAQDNEAARHYKVGLVALENNDFRVAAEEFGEAVRLAPNNGLAHYNLAIVLSKQDRPQEALKSIEKAIDLGLPSREKDTAEDLVARLTYAAKRADAMRPSWLNGNWVFETIVQRSTSPHGTYCQNLATRTVERWNVHSESDDNGQNGALTYNVSVSYLDPNCSGKHDDYEFTHKFYFAAKSTVVDAVEATLKYSGCTGDCDRSFTRIKDESRVVFRNRSSSEIGVENPQDLDYLKIPRMTRE